MAISTNKKVLIVRFDRDTLPGFVNTHTYLCPEGVEILSPTGSVSVVPYADIKLVCFVNDFRMPDFTGERRVFASRPKIEGLWLRMRFRDGEELEGVAPNNLLQLDPRGFVLVPPGLPALSPRIFVPRAALSELLVLGVIGTPLRRRKARPAAKEQLEMFD